MAAWHLDPVTLREVVDDRATLKRELEAAAPVERIWLLRVLGRPRDAVVEGRRLLPDEQDSWRLSLLLAHAHHWLGEWPEAARLHDLVLQVVVDTTREPTTRQHIGKRLLDEGRADEALVQLEHALRLRELAGADPELIASSQAAVTRARAVTDTHGQSSHDSAT